MRQFSFSLWIIGFYTFVSGVANPSRTVAFTFFGQRLLLIFGYHGNCTQGHVLQFNWNGIRFPKTLPSGTRLSPSWATMTYRSPSHLETTWHLRWQPLLVDMNSAHLARRFGRFHDTDFGGYYRWGKHMDL